MKFVPHDSATFEQTAEARLYNKKFRQDLENMDLQLHNLPSRFALSQRPLPSYLNRLLLSLRDGESIDPGTQPARIYLA